jgi:hypothetical protein
MTPKPCIECRWIHSTQGRHPLEHPRDAVGVDPGRHEVADRGRVGLRFVVATVFGKYSRDDEAQADSAAVELQMLITAQNTVTKIPVRVRERIWSTLWRSVTCATSWPRTPASSE